jgi:hypothetical protein
LTPKFETCKEPGLREDKRRCGGCKGRYEGDTRQAKIKWEKTREMQGIVKGRVLERGMECEADGEVLNPRCKAIMAEVASQTFNR